MFIRTSSIATEARTVRYHLINALLLNGSTAQSSSG
jgi:hypothetical protein